MGDHLKTKKKKTTHGNKAEWAKHQVVYQAPGVSFVAPGQEKGALTSR